MRGLDGNYLNTQGDAIARMQVAYQAEQNRQQIRAQMESTEELRKLREDVNAATKKDASGGPPEVKDDQGAGSQAFERPFGEDEPKKRKDISVVGREEEKAPPKLSHIDIRV